VELLVTVTLASGTTAPLASVTVPTMPLRPCASTPDGEKQRNKQAAKAIREDGREVRSKSALRRLQKFVMYIAPS
jgi:hypothetical protein